MDAAFHIKPFAFDRIFAMAAAEAPTVRPEDLALQIAALEAELERSRADHEAALALGRAEAFSAGLDQARGERDIALLAALDALHAGIEAIDGRLDETFGAISADAAEVALAAGELIAAHAIALAPGAAIDQAIGRVLGQVARGKELQIRVSPELVEEITRLIAERQSGERRRLNLHVVGDDTLPLGDARIEWDQGGLSLDAAARVETVRAELGALLPQA